MKKFISIVLTSFVVFTLSCGPKQENTAQSAADKIYTIATDAKYPPFSMENKDGKYVGVDVELLAAIAKEEGFKYELKPMDFSGIIPGLVSGQLDGAIAGMTITKERKKSVDFSAGYIKSGLSIVVNKKDTAVKEFTDLKGKVAAVKKGTTGANWAEDNKDKYGFTVRYFDDSPATMLAVTNGNADFLLEDYPVIAYETKIGKQEHLRIAIAHVEETPPEYGFAVSKDKNPELLKKFNDGLKKINDNGTYNKIINEYLSGK